LMWAGESSSCMANCWLHGMHETWWFIVVAPALCVRAARFIVVAPALCVTAARQHPASSHRNASLQAGLAQWLPYGCPGLLSRAFSLTAFAVDAIVVDSLS
jgi:hypothetical protein